MVVVFGWQPINRAPARNRESHHASGANRVFRATMGRAMEEFKAILLRSAKTAGKICVAADVRRRRFVPPGCAVCSKERMAIESATGTGKDRRALGWVVVSMRRPTPSGGATAVAPPDTPPKRGFLYELLCMIRVSPDRGCGLSGRRVQCFDKLRSRPSSPEPLPEDPLAGSGDRSHQDF